MHFSDAEVYHNVIPEKLHGQPNSKALVHMAVVKTSDDRIEMTQNQVYGAAHQDGGPVTAVDKIEMTQNQVYGAAHQDGGPVTAVDKIEMTQNQVYGAAHKDGGPVTAVYKIEMTQNQVYGTQNTVAESAARNQPSYQNIVSNTSYFLDEVQENSQDQEAGVAMAVEETSDDKIENQLYRMPLASAAGQGTHTTITMEANMSYGVTGIKGSPQLR